MNEGMENLREIEELESQPLNRIASALEEIKNPYSGETCQLPRYAVAVYDVIKGAEMLEDSKTMRKGIDWMQKWFTPQYYTLLD